MWHKPYPLYSSFRGFKCVFIRTDTSNWVLFSSERECRRICYDSTIPLGLEIGQAVYCEKPDGSNPTKFKVSYLSKSDISAQSEMLSSRNENKSFDRFIFDGETPANYNSIVKGDKDGGNAIYIGSPLFIKKTHCYYKLKREQGSNLLIVGQDKKAATSVIYHSILQIMNGISSKDAIFICDKHLKIVQHTIILQN